jgi:hypothetical protein
MRSQTLAIFFLVIFFVIALSMADHPEEGDHGMNNGYGDNAPAAKGSASTAEFSFMTVAVMTFASLVRFLI